MIKFDITNPPTKERIGREKIYFFSSLLLFVLWAVFMIISCLIVKQNLIINIVAIFCFALFGVLAIFFSSIDYIEDVAFLNDADRREQLEQATSFPEGKAYICQVRQQGRRITHKELSKLVEEYEKRKAISEKQAADKLFSDLCQKG